VSGNELTKLSGEHTCELLYY